MKEEFLYLSMMVQEYFMQDKKAVLTDSAWAGGRNPSGSVEGLGA